MRTKSRLRRKTIFGSYMFLLPALIAFTVFFVIPCLTSVYYSFTSWDGVAPVKNWVGLENYTNIFTNSTLARTFPATIQFAVVNTILLNVCSLLVALALNRKGKMTGLLRILYYVPAIMSGVVVGYLFRQIFAPVYKVDTMQMGALNAILYSIGLGDLARNWLNDPATAMVCVNLVSLWQQLGFYTLIYLSNMQNIPKDYYEAAEIDGAGSWQKFKRITWPQLAPSLTINLTLIIIGSLKSFDLIMAMTEGKPMGMTKVISYAIYESAFINNKVGLASAYSVVLTAAVGVLTLVVNFLLRRREDKIDS